MALSPFRDETRDYYAKLVVHSLHNIREHIVGNNVCPSGRRAVRPSVRPHVSTCEQLDGFWQLI
jgi:hypothetical protein